MWRHHPHTHFQDSAHDCKCAAWKTVALTEVAPRNLQKRPKWAFTCDSIVPWQMLATSVESEILKVLCIAMVQYSSLCVIAVVLILDGFDIAAVDVHEREHVDRGEKVEARDREERTTRTYNARSNMWHHGRHADGLNAHQRHFEPQCGVCTRWKCSRKIVWVVLWSVSVYKDNAQTMTHGQPNHVVRENAALTLDNSKVLLEWILILAHVTGASVWLRYHTWHKVHITRTNGHFRNRISPLSERISASVWTTQQRMEIIAFFARSSPRIAKMQTFGSGRQSTKIIWRRTDMQWALCNHKPTSPSHTISKLPLISLFRRWWCWPWTPT